MVLYITGAAAGAALIALGVTLAKKKGTQLWHIMSIAGTAVFTVFAVFLISYIAGNASADRNVPALANESWRTERSYSRDYQLNDDLSICVSPIEEQTGYAVYDSSDGERIGSLIWEGDKAVTGKWTLKIKDVNGDGSNDVGVVTDSDEIIWFTFLPDKEFSADNPNGCFEIIK